MASPFDRPPGYFVDLDLRLADSRLLDIYRHWTSLKHGADVPLVDRFDPLDLGPHLGDLFVVRVEYAQGRDPVFRYTLIGTRLVEEIGRDATNLVVGDTFPSDHPVTDVYRYLVSHRAAVRTHGRLDWVDKDYRSFESVLMPLADADGRIVKVIGAAMYNAPTHDIVGDGCPA